MLSIFRKDDTLHINFSNSPSLLAPISSGRASTCTEIHAHIHTDAHTHTHTYTHINTHTETYDHVCHCTLHTVRVMYNEKTNMK